VKLVVPAPPGQEPGRTARPGVGPWPPQLGEGRRVRPPRGPHAVAGRAPTRCCEPDAGPHGSSGAGARAGVLRRASACSRSRCPVVDEPRLVVWLVGGGHVLRRVEAGGGIGTGT
jgi:hypothetical protein